MTDIKSDKHEIKAKLDKLGKVHPDLVAQIDDVSEWLIGEMESVDFSEL